jgi:hypothetical protein
MSNRSSLLVLALVAGTLASCEKRLTDNPDVASQFRNSKYNDDIVTGSYRDDTEDQGKGVRPETLMAIDQRITDVFAVDFRHCLEDQMDESDSRFMRAQFRVQFTIEPTGQAHDAQVLKIDLSKQDAKGHDVGTLPPVQLGQCIVSAVDTWKFDPAPEVAFVDTYEGKLGEAY